MVYDPLKYWNKRGKSYSHTERLDELDNLNKWINKYNLVDAKKLEVGAGEGRVYNYLNKAEATSKYNFVMCDFVSSFRKICYKQTGILPDKWDGDELPYSSSSFGLVISFSVLLHVVPNKIEQVFKEHARVSNGYIFVATWFEDLNGKGDEHCFEHDYYHLFRQNNLKIIEDKECYFDHGAFRRKNWMLEK